MEQVIEQCPCFIIDQIDIPAWKSQEQKRAANHHQEYPVRGNARIPKTENAAYSGFNWTFIGPEGLNDILE